MLVRPTFALSLLSLALALAACGGGGGGGGSTSTPSGTTASSSSTSSATASSAASSTAASSAASSTTSSATSSTATSSAASSATSSAASSTASSTSSGFALSVDCSGSNCGAASATAYSGSGVGIWSASAPSTGALSGRFTLSNVAGKSVTLVWANPQGSASTTPASTAAMLTPGDNSFETRLASERQSVRATLATAPKSTATPILRSLLAAATTGDTRSWYDSYTGTTISTTLRTTASLSSGQQLNIWVRNADWGSGSYKVTQSMVDTLASKFATTNTGVFDLVTNLIGKPWGSHSYASTMIPATQDINIIVTNFVQDYSPGGTVGYFHSMNNFLTSVYGSSNQALAFFVDSETLASPTNSSYYQAVMVSTLAHEFTHMISFYQREVLLGSTYGYDTWQEEMMAEMMQDLVDTNLSTTYHNLRDSRFPGWLKNGFANCNLTAFVTSTSSCFGYYSVASLGGFLQRQYGTNFLPRLLARTETDSLGALDATIKSFDSSASVGSALTRWATAAALLNSSTLPAGYGYPAVSSGYYNLIALNGPDFSSSRSLSALPTNFAAWSISAQTYTATSSTFTRAVTIPAGARLSVVVN